MRFLIIFILVQILRLSSANQWIDPYDMNTRAKSKLKLSSSSSSDSTADLNKNTYKTCEKDDSINYVFYLKRLVSLMVHSSALDQTDPLKYEGHILFNINKENYDFLLNFAKMDAPDLLTLRKLDSVLSDSLGRTQSDEYLEIVLTFHDRLYHAIFSEKTLWLFGACIMVYIVYQLFKANFSLKYIMGYLFVLVLIADFCLRYIQEEEDAREHNVNIKYSALCDPGKMNWFEYFQFVASSRDCEKKVVTPLSVFLFQVKSLIIVPMHALGTGVGGFGKEMFVTLPWGLNLVMWPMMMLCCVIMGIFFMGFITNQTIEFNFCHLLKLKFGGRSDGFNVTNMLTGKTVDKLLDAISNKSVGHRQENRPMIQEVQEPVEEIPPAITNKNVKVGAIKLKEDKQLLITRDLPKFESEPSKSITAPTKKESLSMVVNDNGQRHSEQFEEKFREQTEEMCHNQVLDCRPTITDVGASGDHCSLSDESDSPNKSHFLDEIEKILEKPDESIAKTQT